LTDDDWNITSVGLSALRWRTRINRPLNELLSELATEPVDPAELRLAFAAVLRGFRSGRRVI
jgi:hypothetical protein